MAADLFSKRVSTEKWDRFDVAIEKPYIYSEADKVSIAYIKNNMAYLTSSNFPMYYITGEVHPIGYAIDIAICYDGRWQNNGAGTYSIFTIGDPYIAIVNTNNTLSIRQGASGTATPLATGVTKCCMVRGWKHATLPGNDQGLTVFYIKQGRLYSKSYRQLSDGQFIWSPEQTYNVPNGIIDLSAKRTHDYRIMVGLHYPEKNGIMLTDREWPGQAVPEEVVSYGIKNVDNTTFTKIKIHNEQITEVNKPKFDTPETSRFTHNTDKDTIVGALFNTDGSTIQVSLNNIPNANSLLVAINNIVITDATGFVYTIVSATYAYPYVTLHVLDFNNSSGALTLEYTSGMFTEDNRSIGAFIASFMPTGLIPVPPDPPTVVSIINVDTEVV